MPTLSTPPVRNEPNPLTQGDIEFLQETQYRQDLHRSMMESFLVVIRRHPDAEKNNEVSTINADANLDIPAPSEEQKEKPEWGAGNTPLYI